MKPPPPDKTGRIRTLLAERGKPFVEHSAEATAACLVAMVQGNVLSLTLTHWAIASQTGIAAGAATALALVVTRVRRPWVLSMLLGIMTTIADYCTHDGSIGPFVTEAVLTGIGAALLCGLVQWLRSALARRGAR